LKVPRCAKKIFEISIVQYRGHSIIPTKKNGLLNFCKICLKGHWLPCTEANEEETPGVLCWRQGLACPLPTHLTAALNAARYSIFVKLLTLTVHVQKADQNVPV